MSRMCIDQASATYSAEAKRNTKSGGDAIR